MTPSELLAAFETFADAPDGTQRLRELVLDLAFHGKLLQQNPMDEPASVLLSTMRADKENRRKRNGVSAGDETTAPYPLPHGWVWCKLESVAHDLGQKVPSEPFSYIDVGSIDNQKGVVAPDLAVINPEDAPSRARKLVDVGTVIYSTVRPYLLNVAILEKKYSPGPIVSTAFAVLHPRNGVSNRYLYFLLRSPYFIGFVANEMRGVAYPAINDTNLMRAPIPLPPTAEQRRIVTKVDELMALIDKLESARATRENTRTALRDSALAALGNAKNTEELQTSWARICSHGDSLLKYPEDVLPIRQTILQLAILGRLVPQNPNDEPAAILFQRISAKKAQLVHERKIRPDDLSAFKPQEMPFDIPASWTWVQLGSLCFKITDGAHHTPQYLDAGIPFLSVKDVSGGTIDFSRTRFISKSAHDELSKRCNPELGDILLTKVGTTGIAVTVDVKKEFSIFVSLALLKFSQSDIDRFFGGVPKAVEIVVAFG